MLTINEIIAKFEEIAEEHLQINKFICQPSSEAAVDENLEYYPLLFVYPSGVSLTINQQRNDVSRVFTIMVVSRYIEDSVTNIEVLSDMELILLDVIAALSKKYETEDDMIINIQNSATPIMDGQGSIVAGWMLDVEISVPYTRDYCAVPK